MQFVSTYVRQEYFKVDHLGYFLLCAATRSAHSNGDVDDILFVDFQHHIVAFLEEIVAIWHAERRLVKLQR